MTGRRPGPGTGRHGQVLRAVLCCGAAAASRMRVDALIPRLRRPGVGAGCWHVEAGADACEDMPRARRATAWEAAGGKDAHP